MRVPAEQAKAVAFLNWLLAPGPDGTKAAMARRMGNHVHRVEQPDLARIQQGRLGRVEGLLREVEGCDVV